MFRPMILWNKYAWAPLSPQAEERFRAYQTDLHKHTDHLFAGLMVVQWLGLVVAALWLTPYTWSGEQVSVHLHVWAACLTGGLVTLVPAAVAVAFPGRLATRVLMGVSQMLFSALLIHVTGGRIETHFHVFGSLAFLAFYRDWRVLIPATVVVAVDHFVRGIFLPYSVFGALTASPWRAVEHAAWVVFEDVFLLLAIRQGITELRQVARREVELEEERQQIEQKVAERTNALADSERRFSLAMEATTEGLWDWNIATGKVYFSPTWIESLGYEPDEVPGRIEFWEQIVHPDDWERASRELEKHFAGETEYYDCENRLRTKSGEYRWNHDRGRVVARDNEGNPIRMVGTDSDITERKEREFELQRMTEAAEAASRAKSDFLANMSHEIRTPMTAILGFAELLESEDDVSRDPAKVNEAVSTIRNHAQHLLTVINDVLDVSKIEAGKMTVEHIETPLPALLDEAGNLLRPRAEGKGIKLHLEYASQIPEHIQTDPTRLRQILLNLLGNAVKFTEQGAVSMRVAYDESARQLRVAVVDTGVGMSPEQLAAVSRFEAFHQADYTMARQFGGTGLGLKISDSFARILGGALEVESQRGRGSTFTLALGIDPATAGPLVTVQPGDPNQASPQSAPAKPEPAAKPLAGRRVLLAEDGPDNQRLIGFVLKKAGAEVTTADNGRIAVDKIEAQGPFDVVLMDMQMPELDGYSATRMLREQGYSRPIIALTAHAMAEDRQKCLDAGCDEYTTKPIDRPKLISLVAEYSQRAATVEA